MITFKKLKFKNFGSFGNYFTNIDFTDNELILVSGLNGRGKSFAYLDAITFALYGKPFRKINIPQLINTVNGKNCAVELEFSVGSNEYTIKRGLSPKLFEIYKNGTLLDQNAKSKDCQDFLETQIVKMNYKTFTQVVILGRSSFVPFLQLSPADRRNIIENILDINVFSNMNQIAKGKLSFVKENINETNRKIENIEEKIEYQEKFISKIQDQKTSSETKIKEKIELINESITSSNNSINQIMSSMIEGEIETDLETLKDKKVNLKTEEKSLVTKIVKSQKDVDFYDDNENCPVCKQSIDLEFRKNKIEDLSSSVKKLESALDNVKVFLGECDSMLTSKTEDLNKNKKLEEQHNINKNIIERYENDLENLNIELNKPHEDADELEKENKNLEELRIKKETLEESLKQYDIKKMEYSACVSLLKDSGIKSKIIKHYLPLINKVINTFLTNMNFFTKFELNEEFEETIKSRHRDKFSYMSFSEGEKLRIDLALLFAWREVAKVKNSAHCNLLILDEIFDSSLDSSGTEELMRNLYSLKKTGSVIVISHKLDQMADKFDKIVVVEKKNSFSSLKKK
jgi:DNA repair exonuclease SbcCD ATPase subunit|tara:strand:+ start:4303 stop:6021 length:1719 start_codon:yes stop_codon:yes gene_type:complete